MRRKVSAADVGTLVEQSGTSWRYTRLMATIQARHQCAPSTAQRSIAQALANHLVIQVDGRYTAPGTRPPTSSDEIGRRRFVDRHRMLQLIGDRTWRYADLLELLQTSFGCSNWAARTNIRYAITYGYLTKHGTHYHLTLLAHHQLANYGRLQGQEGFRYARFVSGHPKRGLHR
jgi:hypothetical protein